MSVKDLLTNINSILSHTEADRTLTESYPIHAEFAGKLFESKFNSFIPTIVHPAPGSLAQCPG